MVNLYAIQCDVFPKNKIIKILKFNNFHFFPQKPQSAVNIVKYLSFNEDKMCFIGKAIVLTHFDSEIIIGSTFREEMNESAFQIYFPNQLRDPYFNYNPEFSKALLGINDFTLNQTNPISSINLHKKNIDKIVNEYDITFENTQERDSKKFKPVSFAKIKWDGIEKLFLYKQNDFFIIIGWIMQGRRNRNKIIYNKSFTDFLMSINPFELQTPQNINYQSLKKNNNNIKNDAFESKKNVLKSALQNNQPITNHTPNMMRINTILEKITKSGINSLSGKEITFLDNSFGKV